MNYAILIISLISFHACHGIIRTQQEFINAQARDGYTALHCAVEKNQQSAVSLLLKNNANPLIQVSEKTAFQLAVQNNLILREFREAIRRLNLRDKDQKLQITQQNADDIILSLIYDSKKYAGNSENNPPLSLVNQVTEHNLLNLANEMQNLFNQAWEKEPAPKVSFQHLVIPRYRVEQDKTDRNYTLHGFHYDKDLALYKAKVYLTNKEPHAKNVYKAEISATINNNLEKLGPKSFFPYSLQPADICRIIATALENYDPKTLDHNDNYWLFHSKLLKWNDSRRVRVQLGINEAGLVYIAYPDTQFKETSTPSPITINLIITNQNSGQATSARPQNKSLKNKNPTTKRNSYSNGTRAQTHPFSYQA